MPRPGIGVGPDSVEPWMDWLVRTLAPPEGAGFGVGRDSVEPVLETGIGISLESTRPDGLRGAGRDADPFPKPSSSNFILRGFPVLSPPHE
jgi:hypothetical protein